MFEEDLEFKEESEYYYCDEDCDECHGNVVIQEPDTVKKYCSKKRLRDSTVIMREKQRLSNSFQQKSKRGSSPLKQLLDEGNLSACQNSISHVKKNAIENSLLEVDKELEAEKKAEQEVIAEEQKALE